MTTNKDSRKEVREQSKGSGRSQTASAQVSEQPKEKRQRHEHGDGKGVGGRELGNDGSGRSQTSTSGSNKPRGVAQRSSTSQGGRQRTDASDIKMEMDIEMKLRDGRSAITKYSVSCLTPMQSVINKVS